MRPIGSMPWRLLWCAGAGVIATVARGARAGTRLPDRASSRPSATPRGRTAAGARRHAVLRPPAGGVYAASGVTRAVRRGLAGGRAGALRAREARPGGRCSRRWPKLRRRPPDRTSLEPVRARARACEAAGAHRPRRSRRAAAKPFSIYVPLDTIRDYLFAADAGRMVAEAIGTGTTNATRRGRRGENDHKIFASEVETTIASVLGAWRQALRRPPRVALAPARHEPRQPRVSAFRSRVWPETSWPAHAAPARDRRGAARSTGSVDQIRRALELIHELTGLEAASPSPGRGL